MWDKYSWYTVGGIVIGIFGTFALCYGLRKLYLAYDKQLKLEYLRQYKREIKLERRERRRQARRERQEQERFEEMEKEAKRVKEAIALKKKQNELINKFRNEYIQRYPDNIYDPEFRNWVKETEKVLPGIVLEYNIVDKEYLEQLSD